MDEMTLKNSLAKHPMVRDFILALANAPDLIVLTGEYDGKKYVSISGKNSKDTFTFTEADSGYLLTRETTQHE